MITKTTLSVFQLTPSTITNSDAVWLRLAMKEAIINGEAIVLSFHGISTLTTSFLNSSIGEIIDEFGFDALKGRLSLVDYTTVIGKAVTDYIGNLKKHQSH